MQTSKVSRLLTTLLALAAVRVSADTVETKSGARIIGKIDKIENGAVVVSTDYAGVITIKQSEIASLSTDAPVAVRLESGTRIDGPSFASGHTASTRTIPPFVS